MNLNYYSSVGTLNRNKLLALKIIDDVCNEFGLRKDELLSIKREKDLVLARHIAIYLIKQNTELKLIEIGVLFKRDHSTILHAIEKINDYYDTKNITVIDRIKKLSAQLN